MEKQNDFNRQMLTQRNIITLNAPEKHSNPRMWKVSPRLIAMLNSLPKNNQIVFGNAKMDSMKSMFLTSGKKLAVKLQDPRLMKVNFHSFRHWKATMLYHQTKDSFFVRDFLGHKRMENTELYASARLEPIIFGDSGNDERALVGFEYACQKDNLIFLRKRR